MIIIIIIDENKYLCIATSVYLYDSMYNHKL